MLVTVTAHRFRTAGIGRFMQWLFFLLGSYTYMFIPPIHLVLPTATLLTWTAFEVNLLSFPATTDTYLLATQQQNIEYGITYVFCHCCIH